MRVIQKISIDMSKPMLEVPTYKKAKLLFVSFKGGELRVHLEVDTTQQQETIFFVVYRTLDFVQQDKSLIHVGSALLDSATYHVYSTTRISTGRSKDVPEPEPEP
jgi:hypothetical protein